MEKRIDEMITALTRELKSKRMPDGIWRGKLSSSAISTSVAIFALHLIDKDAHQHHIDGGTAWLHQNILEDGSWGDSAESRPNMTATLLAYAALSAVDRAPVQTEQYLTQAFGGISDQQIISGVLAYYGKDLTFSAPILVMCALAGIIHDWHKIPRLPFELSVIPQRFFRFLRLPVVSYAIPALIAVGVLRHKQDRKTIVYRLREKFIAPSLRVLQKLQPPHGGFLEAAPLTAFVGMCMSGAGYRHHQVTAKAAQFLTATVRTDGSWPIDTDLATWATHLSIKALCNDTDDKSLLDLFIRQQAFNYIHPFTGAHEGGWGWSDLPGAVPDADDTSGSLVALHLLRDGTYCPEIENGINWLLKLQNSDGGIPTFCKGWGKLPFDRSSPDISAHALMAFELWKPALPTPLLSKCEKSIERMLKWMEKTRQKNGSWIPLWFGDQDANDELSPVYGTAVVVENLSASSHPLAMQHCNDGALFLINSQNKDGGWGGAKGVTSKVTLTAKALSALSTSSQTPPKVIENGFNYLYLRFKQGNLNTPEPIGLYFARLWYSEEIYSLAFTLQALKNIKKHYTH